MEILGGEKRGRGGKREKDDPHLLLLLWAKKINDTNNPTGRYWENDEKKKIEKTIQRKNEITGSFQHKCRDCESVSKKKR